MNLSQTEKEMLIQARIGQGIFRENLIKRYKACIITGIADRRLLIASHIKPWRCADNNERLSPENGLLLSPLYDKLFDTGLISFDRDTRIMISPSLTEAEIKRIGIDTEKAYITAPSTELLHNMEYHRDVVFLK